MSNATQPAAASAAPVAAPAPAPAPVPAPPKQPPSISGNRVKLAEVVYRNHHAIIDSAVDRQAIFNPVFWAHCTHKLRPLDTIRVMDEMGTWVVELIVRGVGATEVLVAELWSKNIGAGAAADLADAYEVKWRSHKAKWSVLSTANGAVVIEGMETREEAEAWARSHAKAMAA